MTKENKLHRGDAWFTPSDPEKLVVFKKPDLTALKNACITIGKALKKRLQNCIKTQNKSIF